ncbi:ArsR/SmtB family transcription factor [Cellulomonas wangsupingiae]|uniref:Metalloregulator ArsR/SmtB family transcription factor n=1 Tax=Cellulomonas wangsupingiae TaxID=2968085 RepID=A0ABY5K7B2_9CELL|nr:metalloregulator ArsR/SmtB family transcription factor [Cellulomonas wangsupingiae]MCC2334700.1 metalloregulator ArsR/SmtB family transcription factor [Cellulomonas wangsupingiae]UUI66342.1 metalloregulator ArsR/SmtB family transcription factor [Cellulomonas wangsupingiae]
MLQDRAVDRVFHALADATRRDILRRVLVDPASVSTIAGRYEMSFAAVQKHVAVLEQAHLVVKERRGRQQIVHGDVEAVRRATRLLTAMEEQWRARVGRMSVVLAELDTGHGPEVAGVSGPHPPVPLPGADRPTGGTS